MKLRYLLLVMLVTSASALAAKIPMQVKKSVVFVFAKDSSSRLSPLGTGFFVLLRTNQNTDTANFGYLVTSKNVLKRIDGSFYDTVYIRINRKEGYSDTLIIPLVQKGVRRYFLHPDSTVDLAVIPAYPDLNRYDLLFIPFGMIAQMDFFKKENLGEGDEVFHIGMLSAHIGMFKNIPIVRFGKVAQLSEEKYMLGKSYTELFLVETAITPGSMGSPLYYYAPASKDTGSGTLPAKFFLTGIISGSYGEVRPERTKNDTGGLVGVVPAYKLSELLNVPGISQEREKEFTRMQNAKSK